jgi:phosphoglycolate phosphatase
MNFKAYIFDLDGTVLNTATDLANAVNKMRQSFELDSLPVKEVLSYLGDGAQKLVARSLKDTDINLQDALTVFLDCYEKGICIETDFYPGLREFLEELKRQGIPAGILTNKPQLMTDKLVEALNIADLFKFTYGPDQFGKKPDPNGLIECLKILKTDPQDAVMVGDHHTDMYAANAAGVKNIFVSYGFGNKGESSVDYEIDKGEELFKFL